MGVRPQVDTAKFITHRVNTYNIQANHRAIHQVVVGFTAKGDAIFPVATESILHHDRTVCAANQVPVGVAVNQQTVLAVRHDPCAHGVQAGNIWVHCDTGRVSGKVNPVPQVARNHIGS